jgi:molybdopterin-containing oxidoreductase family membrane subunit
MAAEIRIMGLFRDDGQAAQAIRDLGPAGFIFRRAHSPVPSHKIMEALKLKKSPVGWFTLAGGIIGFFSGFALAIFSATRWDLIASGKPVISLIPFVIVGFEFTVLFAVFGNVIGLLTCMRLPDYKGLDVYDPRCSSEHFGVLAACESSRRGELTDFFQKKGGEVRVFA